MPMRPPIVVLVEDAETDVRAARRMLSRLYPDVELRDYPSAEALLEELDRTTPQELWPRLFIFDVNLPGMTGIELLDQLQTSDWRRVPAIILSGSANDAEVQRCYAHGAAGHFTKPFGREDLDRVWSAIVDYWLVLATPTNP